MARCHWSLCVFTPSYTASTCVTDDVLFLGKRAVLSFDCSSFCCRLYLLKDYLVFSDVSFFFWRKTKYNRAFQFLWWTTSICSFEELLFIVHVVKHLLPAYWCILTKFNSVDFALLNVPVTWWIFKKVVRLFVLHPKDGLFALRAFLSACFWFTGPNWSNAKPNSRPLITKTDRNARRSRTQLSVKLEHVLVNRVRGKILLS